MSFRNIQMNGDGVNNQVIQTAAAIRPTLTAHSYNLEEAVQGVAGLANKLRDVEDHTPQPYENPAPLADPVTLLDLGGG